MEGSSKTHVMPAQTVCAFNAIISESVEKLQLLSLIMSDSKSRGHQKRSKTDMHTLLLRRSELERKYEQLMKRRNELKGLHNKKNFERNQKQIQELSEALRESIKTISTNLSESNNPDLAKNLIKVEKDRYILESLLQLTIKELNTDRTFNTLKTRVTSQLDDLHNLDATKKKRAVISESLKEIEAHLKKERELFEKNVKSREDEISKLTLKLQHLKAETAATQKYEASKAAAAANTHKRMIRREIGAIDSEIDAYKGKLANEGKINEAATTFLVNRQNEMKAKFEEWTKKFNTDKKRMQNQLDDLTEDRDSVKIELDALRARVEDYKQEEKHRLDLERKKKEALAVRREEERKMFTAASKIRFYWNVFWRKEGSKSKGKKKKKGKKK